MGSTTSSSRRYGEGEVSLAFLQKIFHLSSSDVNSFHSLSSHSFNLSLGVSGGDHGSRIDYLSFCSLVHCEEDTFTSHLFSFFSSFQSQVHSLTFNEFLLFLYFFLSLDENQLIEFLYFFIVDHYLDQKGHLPPSSQTSLTIEQSIHHLFGNDWGDSHQIHHVLSILDQDLHGELTFEQFKKGLLTNRSLLFRIVSYQMDIQRKIFSESYWKGRAEVITSEMIRDIRKIRNELHQLEREEFLHQSPPPPHEDLQLKPLSDMEDEAEVIDPRLVSLPVSRHKKSHRHHHHHHKSSDSSHNEHLPSLHEAVPPPHPQFRHRNSSPLPELPTSKESHSLFDSENQVEAHHQLPTRGHILDHSTSSVGEVTGGSSQIHTLQRLKTLNHHHSSSEILHPLLNQYPPLDLSPPLHQEDHLPEVKANKTNPNPSQSHTIHKSHSLHHHHSTASAASTNSSDAT